MQININIQLFGLRKLKKENERLLLTNDDLSTKLDYLNAKLEREHARYSLAADNNNILVSLLKLGKAIINLQTSKSVNKPSAATIKSMRMEFMDGTKNL